MIATNSIELKSGFDLFLDKVENENETLFIESEKGKGVVMISKQEYNSILETLHLLSSKKNYEHLLESKKQMEEGSFIAKNIQDLNEDSLFRESLV